VTEVIYQLCVIDKREDAQMDKCVDGSTFREVHNCFQDFLTHSWEADRWLNIFPYTFFLKCIGKTLVNGQIIIWWSGNGHEPSLKLERRCVDRWSCSRWFTLIERNPPLGEFPIYYIPWPRTGRKRDPTEEPPHKLMNLGVVLQGGSFSSRFLITEHGK